MQVASYVRALVVYYFSTVVNTMVHEYGLRRNGQWSVLIS